MSIFLLPPLVYVAKCLFFGDMRKEFLALPRCGLPSGVCFIIDLPSAGVVSLPRLPSQMVDHAFLPPSARVSDKDMIPMAPFRPVHSSAAVSIVRYLRTFCSLSLPRLFAWLRIDIMGFLMSDSSRSFSTRRDGALLCVMLTDRANPQFFPS